MRPSSLLLLTLSSLVFACRAAPKEAPSSELANEASKAAPTTPERPEAQRFGQAIQGHAALALERVLASPAEFQKKSVIVEGKVRKACSRKGCWMELAASNEPSAPGCRVTFKDYGFFVPTDSAGSSARVEAAVEVASLEPRHVAHMEAEGATIRNKRPDGSADEVRLVATGVELWR